MSLSTVHTFQLPGLPVKLALGHRYDGWYLLFARPYPTADSREVARIDAPAPKSRPSPTRHAKRFWFSSSAQSGWESTKFPTLLDLLLALDVRQQPLFAVLDHDSESGSSHVLVLLREEKLAHFCEGCTEWETAEDNSLRWYMVRTSGDALPGYLCPSCHAKDWCGAQFARYLRRMVS
ncbi:hypothetical protein MIND_00404200 [Mycena indigotica]|uniref:Uncharacterized protein n=1 Tax=Mycena indigotica TaxID=2126181 RepID=A0A8H6T5G0_9AGAR|nr:uncharacterized protein MIND_00404200 [Mycena indigotica]KAF7310302.1 hypothetical protein MIND_00404200 [Mycena indigotica]